MTARRVMGKRPSRCSTSCSHPRYQFRVQKFATWGEFVLRRIGIPEMIATDVKILPAEAKTFSEISMSSRIAFSDTLLSFIGERLRTAVCQLYSAGVKIREGSAGS